MNKVNERAVHSAANSVSTEETWEALQHILVEVLAVAPEKVVPGARLVEDLGMG